MAEARAGVRGRRPSARRLTAERVLTRRELNRALLARQLLLERADSTIPRVLEQVAGLQAQDTVAPFVGLWTRLAGFEREKLVRLLARRSVVRGTLMRGTVHLVTARDYLRLIAPLAPMIAELYRSYLRGRDDLPDLDELTARALAYAAEPRSRRELVELLGEDGWWRVRRNALFLYAPDGGARWAFERSPRFVSANAWLGREPGGEAAGLRLLVRRYLAAFGPATAQDLAAWSGLPLATLRPVLEQARLRRFRDEQGRELLDLPGAPLPHADTSAPPRLLAAYDNAILSHADRTRVIDDEHRRLVIRAGIVDPTFLVDGRVAGRWSLERARRTTKVVLDPFDPLPRTAREALEAEADALVRFMAE